MAAFTGAVKVVNKTPNNAAPFYVEHFMSAQALANTDTLDITVPSDYKDWVPVSVLAISPATPRVVQATLAATNHNVSTGVTRLTATGPVAINSTILVGYVPAT